VPRQLHPVVLDVLDIGRGHDHVLLRARDCGHQRRERDQEPDSHGVPPRRLDFVAMVARPAGVVRTIVPMSGNIPANVPANIPAWAIPRGRGSRNRNNAVLAAGSYIGWHKLAFSSYGPAPPGGCRRGVPVTVTRTR